MRTGLQSHVLRKSSLCPRFCQAWPLAHVLQGLALHLDCRLMLAETPTEPKCCCPAESTHQASGAAHHPVRQEVTKQQPWECTSRLQGCRHHHAHLVHRLGTPSCQRQHGHHQSVCVAGAGSALGPCHDAAAPWPKEAGAQPGAPSMPGRSRTSPRSRAPAARSTWTWLLWAWACASWSWMQPARCRVGARQCQGAG